MSSKKILFLHGYTQSGPSFAKKSAGLRKALGKLGYTTHYPTGPVPLLVPADAPEEERQRLLSLGYKEDESYAWFVKNDATGEYDGLTETWGVLKAFIETEGPFVGLVGFSQGAVLGGMLVNKLAELVPTHPKLRFAVLFSGFKAEAPGTEKYFPVTIPTLHITGEKDSIVPPARSESLVNACVEAGRKVYQHPGGHFVPSNREVVTVVGSWITETLEEVEK
ncbi:serine hydrolase FSH [Limtongia smithiae]|uniref:serine hydrolase FSH n=1 Tax=Limtongia smithiae TaxID=1125753 RepID=UPI0034D00F0A